MLLLDLALYCCGVWLFVGVQQLAAGYGYRPRSLGRLQWTTLERVISAVGDVFARTPVVVEPAASLSALDRHFAAAGASVGDVVHLRLPPFYRRAGWPGPYTVPLTEVSAMRIGFTDHHFGHDDRPAGGHSYGVGFCIAWQNGLLGRGPEGLHEK